MMDATDLKAKLMVARFLDGLSPTDCDKVAAIASLIRVRPGTVLFQEGEICQTLHVVSTGLVALEMCMPRQGCTRVLTVGDGDVLGWSALLGDGTMTARAIAISETELVALPAQKLRQLCEDSPVIGYVIMRQVALALSRRLLATRLQTLDMFGETEPVAASWSQLHASK